MLEFKKRESAVHSADARVKLAAAFALSLLFLSTLNAPAIAAMLAFVLILYAIARVSPLGAVFDMGPAWIFIFLPIALAVLAGDAGTGIVASARLAGSIMAFLLFIYTTAPRQIADALVWFRLPREMAMMFVMALGFLPLFQRDVQKVRLAQAARGYGRGAFVVPVILPVLRRGFARARTMGLSMDARGFEA